MVPQLLHVESVVKWCHQIHDGRTNQCGVLLFLLCTIMRIRYSTVHQDTASVSFWELTKEKLYRGAFVFDHLRVWLFHSISSRIITPMQQLCSAGFVFFQIAYMYPIAIVRSTVLFGESFVLYSVQSPFSYREPVGVGALSGGLSVDAQAA